MNKIDLHLAYARKVLKIAEIRYQRMKALLPDHEVSSIAYEDATLALAEAVRNEGLAAWDANGADASQRGRTPLQAWLASEDV